MAYLGKIIAKLESALKIKVNGTFIARAEIDGIQFYSRDISRTDDHMLYLSTKDDFSLENTPQFLLLIGTTPARRQNNTVWIENDISMENVINVIQETILEHTIFKLKREELFRALHRGMGLTDLTRLAYSVLDNPVTLCNTSFSILTLYPDTQDSTHFSKINGKFFLKDEFFSNMDERNMIKQLHTSSHPFMAPLENCPFGCVFQSIRINHTVVGYVCVRGLNRKVTDEDLDYIDVFAQIISVEMQKDTNFTQTTGLKYEYFLNELFEGQINSEAYITDQLGALGKSPSDYYGLVLLKHADSALSEQPIKMYVDQIVDLLPDSMFTVYRGSVVVLLPCKADEIFSPKRLKRLSVFLQLNGLRAFVGLQFQHLTDSPILLEQLNNFYEMYTQKYLRPDETVVFFKDYVIEASFYIAKNRKLLEASISPMLKKMLASDRDNNTKYEETLRAFYTCGRSVPEAANYLHIHKSTFFYRLGKMNELFGFDTGDYDLLFLWEYSLKLIDYLN